MYPLRVREQIAATGLVATLRKIPRVLAPELLRALHDGGVRIAEITMESAGAAEMIAAANRMDLPGFIMGAGTVTSVERLEQALAAGARFIVSPAFTPRLVQACVERGVAVIPGAMTPTEILAAWEMGATMVKVFPVGSLGTGYIKALRGPFDDIPLLATGGVNAENAVSFLHAGADAVAVGTALATDQELTDRAWDAIRERSCRLVDVIGRHRSAHPHRSAHAHRPVKENLIQGV